MQDIQKRLFLLHSVINEIFKSESQYITNLSNAKDNISSLLKTFISQNEKIPVSSAIMMMSKMIEDKLTAQVNSLSLLKSELITPLDNYVSQYKKNKLFDQLKQQEKELNQIIGTINKIKQKYYDSMQKVEHSIFDLQMGIKAKIPLDKFKSKASERINEGKAMEKEYKDILETANKKSLEYQSNLIKYNEINKKVSAFENQMATKINVIIVDKLINLQGVMTKDCEILKQVAIHEKKEDNTDNEGTKFTFEEYIPNALSNYQQDEVNFNVLLTLQKHFELKIDTKINCEETKKEILFKNISEHIIQHCQSVTKTEIAELKKIIVEKDYRKRFILFLNQERAKSTQFNSEQGYKNISIVLDFLLSQIEYNSTEEFENIKDLLLLSQSFYKLNDKGKKVYVEESLKNNTLFINENFWKLFMNYLIKKEIEKGDNTNEKVAFFTLITNINNFVGFVKEETKIKEIIQEIEDNYKISDEDRNTIHKELEKEIEKKK